MPRERRLFPPSRAFVPTERRETPRRSRRSRRITPRSRARPSVTPTARSIRIARPRAPRARVLRAPPPTSHDPSRTPIHRGIHVIPCHPIPCHPIPCHPMHASSRPRARTTSQKPELHPNPSRVPPWGDEYGGGTYTRVTTPQSVQSDPQTQTHRRMPRALALPRDVMTTITVHHTFTTTIASPPPPTRPVVPPIHLASSTSSRPLRRRWGRRRTAHVDGSRDARSIDRARGERDDGFGFGSRRTSRRVADDRVRAHSRASLRCIRASRAFVRTRARIRRARRARRGFGRRERWCSRERARVRLARGATRGRGARAARTATRDERDERDERFLPEKGK